MFYVVLGSAWSEYPVEKNGKPITFNTWEKATRFASRYVRKNGGRAFPSQLAI